MSKKLYKTIKITDLKDMLNKTKELYKNKAAYKIKNQDGNYTVISHDEIRDMVDYLGTSLVDMGLKNKRIAIIGENRYEWEVAYLSIVCGTGIVVPLDKALPKKELESLIQRSEVEAIFFSAKFENTLKEIKQNGNNKLKYLISMDKEKTNKSVYLQKELIDSGKKLLEKGNTEFTKAKINPEEMSIMLFTSGTTSKSKVVKLSHKNICTNLMDLGSILDVTSEDILLSVLPIHHVFECTVGFLFSLYKGAQTVFCDGLKHIVENLNEYNATVMASVPGIYETIYSMMIRELKKQGKLSEVLENKEKYKNYPLTEKKKLFKEVHDLLGGNIKLFISGAAALNPEIETNYRDFGFNIVQGYGLTETSPVVAVGTNAEYKTGSIGKAVPSVEVRLENVNSEGIGELVVKGPSVAIGYYNDEEANKKAYDGEWFHTGDLAQIDEEEYIFICGRKKSVIVLRNGKNIFPEEMESLINQIDGVKESFIFGKQQSADKNDVKINVEIVFDRTMINEKYQAITDNEIYQALSKEIKQINGTLPRYKAIRGVILSEQPLIKTTTNKIKRQENLDAINKFKNTFIG